MFDTPKSLLAACENDPWAHQNTSLYYYLPLVHEGNTVLYVGQDKTIEMLLHDAAHATGGEVELVAPEDDPHTYLLGAHGEDRSWDVIVFDALETTPNALLNKAARCLETGGLLMVGHHDVDATEHVDTWLADTDVGKAFVGITDPRSPEVSILRHDSNQHGPRSHGPRASIVDLYVHEKHNKNYVLLHFLAHAMGAQSVLEYGTAEGNSASLFGTAARPYGGTVTSVDDWRDGRASIEDAEQQTSRYELDNVEFVNMEATEHVDQLLQDGVEDEYDIIFHDAHGGDRVSRMQATVPLLKPGGIMLLHDAHHIEHVTARDFQKTPEGDAFHTVLTPQGEGICILKHQPSPS